MFLLHFYDHAIFSNWKTTLDLFLWLLESSTCLETQFGCSLCFLIITENNSGYGTPESISNSSSSLYGMIPWQKSTRCSGSWNNKLTILVTGELGKRCAVVYHNIIFQLYRYILKVNNFESTDIVKYGKINREWVFLPLLLNIIYLIISLYNWSFNNGYI